MIEVRLEHGPLRVEVEYSEFDSGDGIGVFLEDKEIYRAAIAVDPRAEGMELFDAFKAVYDRGFGDA